MWADEHTDGLPPGGPSVRGTAPVTGRVERWAQRCGWALTPFLFLAPLAWPLKAILVVFSISTLVAAVGLASQADADQRAVPLHGTGVWSTRLTRAALLGAGTVALGILVTLSAALTLLVLLGAVACSPWAVDRTWRRLGPASRPSTAPPTVTQMSNAELCAAWRASYEDLQRTPTPAARARVVARRQAFLDELERRDSSGLAAWLESGARAAGGPDHFLSQG